MPYVWGMKTILKERKEYQSWGKSYYHLSSDGWQEGKLFYKKEQSAFGMILMGLLTLRFEMAIYDFCLMENHVHILLSGTGAECCRAFDYFRKKLTARLVKDGFPPLPQNYGFKLTPIKDEEQMRVNYLYIDRNPFEKGLCIPGGYPWGAAYLHCSQMGKYLHGTPAAKIKKHRLELMAGTRTAFPPEWEFHPELGLLPSSFVDNTLFNRLFPSPKDYQTRLVKDYEAFAKLGRCMDDPLTLSDSEVREIAGQMTVRLFPGKQLSSLPNIEKGRLCVQLEDKFKLTTAQIAKALSISEYLVKQFLHSKDFGRKKW